MNTNVLQSNNGTLYSSRPWKNASIIIGIAVLVTIAGFERISINLGPARIRVAYLVLIPLFAVLSFRGFIRLERKSFWLIAGFVLLATPSLALSKNLVRSLIYLGWIITNYLAVYESFSAFARNWPVLTHRALIYSFRLQIIIAWLMVLVGINLNQTAFLGNLESVYSVEFLETFNAGRAYLLYQEPSFFVFALSLYIGYTACSVLTHGIRKLQLDLIILLIAVVSTGSATLLVIIFLAFVVSAMTKLTLKRLPLLICGLVLVLVFAYVLANSQPNTVEDQFEGTRPTGNNTLIFDTLQGIFASGDPLRYLKFRSGGRFMLMDCQWHFFLESPLTGVGIGVYSEYTEANGFFQCLDQADYPLGAGALLYGLRALPVMNIYLELLATVGVFASLLFFAFVLRHIFLRKLHKLSSVQRCYWVGVVIILLAAMAQPTYLNPFLWMTLGVFSGSVRGAKKQPNALTTRGNQHDSI